MSDETLPEDDGAPKFWCWTTDKHPRYTRVAEVPLRRDEAIRRLRDQQPKDLNGATHVTLAEHDLFGLESVPIKPHGAVRIQLTPGEEINRLLAPLMGCTIGMPVKP